MSLVLYKQINEMKCEDGYEEDDDPMVDLKLVTGDEIEGTLLGAFVDGSGAWLLLAGGRIVNTSHVVKVRIVHAECAK